MPSLRCSADAVALFILKMHPKSTQKGNWKMKLCVSSLLLLLSLLGRGAAFQSPRIPNKVVSVDPTIAHSIDQPRPISSGRSTTSLFADTSDSSAPELDTDALVKYGSSIAIQMGIIAALFYGLDTIIDSTGIEVPFPAVMALFFVFSLKSRTFNPLNNQRPNLNKAVNGENAGKGFGDRVMPPWTPPGVTFPIMWILVIAPLRSFTSALVYNANGHSFCDSAILALMLHLSTGDVWNTINNTERRFGTAVPSILIVSATAANAAFQYSQADPFAGKLLGATLLWFAVASTLIADTWRLNPNPETGERDPLYPVTGGEIKTEFAWFGKSQEEK
jgi:benzodiazapine receptor